MNEPDTDVLVARLGRCVPLDALGRDHLKALLRLARVERLNPGQTAFQRGDSDHDAVYLVSGRVDLISADDVSRPIVAGSDKARYALSHLKPRRHDAVANGMAVVVRIDNMVLDRLLTLHQLAGYEVVEFEWPGGDHDWLVRLLQTPLFQRLPALVIQRLLERLEPVNLPAGERVIRAGDRADFYYLIREGRCQVWRAPVSGGAETLVAELAEGQGFGEEALLAGVPRNATVRMVTAGRLLRLAQADFDRLLRASLVRWAEPEAAAEMLAAGARLLDVRLESEFRSGNIPGSINLPLHELRTRTDALDRRCTHLACCDTGNRSSAAAFLLSERGFDVQAVRGGLGALRQARAAVRT